MPRMIIGDGGGSSEAPGGINLPAVGVDLNGKVEIVVQAGIRVTAYPEQKRLEFAPGFSDEVWGDIMFRGENGWQRLPAGSPGQKLQSNGSGADPSWVT